ncbi:MULTISPECIES: hypothetical protein [Helicobacter]|uniref:hypothetical protein n=1 Tax=Helicobacter TaxID=209 RepID=UPI0012E1909D|nr:MULTISPECIES: hypothetical protein [Helicobacter]BEG57235.1 hypothetical protein NHP21005_09230 [Helicobacter sp. NHP21005]BEG58300.1 hypothetical protein NHP21005_19880 [Helicobacter sp. NHP21005]
MPNLKHTQVEMKQPLHEKQVEISEEQRAKIVQDARVACRKRLEDPNILAVYKRLADK